MSPYPLCAGGVWGQDYALHDLHVGSHDYFHTLLEGSAPSRSKQNVQKGDPLQSIK